MVITNLNKVTKNYYEIKGTLFIKFQEGIKLVQKCISEILI